MDDLRDKTILVTGGTGFIGKPLCRKLVDHGAQLLVLSRTPHPSSPAITYLASLAEIGQKKVDIIINLAGEPIAQRWSTSTKNTIRNSRIDVTASLIAYLKSAPDKPSLLISASAIGYYGTDDYIEFDEHSQPTDRAPFARALCTDWENEARKAESYGVRTVLLRLGAVLAKDGGMLAKLLPAFRLGLGGPISHGGQWLSWIDRDDLLKLILHIILTPSLQGPINATAPSPVSNQDFAHTLARVLGRPCFIRTPAFLLRAAFGQMPDEIMLAGQYVRPIKALNSGFVFSQPQLLSSLQKIFAIEP